VASETTLATIRRAPCPVLAVSDGCVGPPQTVVVAMDFSPASLHAARQALPLLADGAVVHLVHAWRRYLALIPDAGDDPRDVAYEHALPERFHRARNVLGRQRSLTFVSSVREGDAAAVILAAAREVRADLIVAGTRGHGVLERVWMGSVSTAVVRGAPCSVFVASEPPPVERGWLERQMTGTSVVKRTDEWAEELDAFARRNRARRTSLEIDGVAIGAQVQESGYALTGAAYDRRDRAVSLMFSDPVDPGAHLTRTLGRVRSVAVSRGPGDRDAALCIECDDGCTLLTFLDGTPG
jgi:Universal stress protein UspA and related nucleotide-binding proteins